MEVSVLAYPRKYLLVGLPVEKYVCWLARGSISLVRAAPDSIVVGLPLEGSLLACPWKYLCWPATVEVSVLAWPWKYLCWPARGSIVRLPVEVYLLASARGSIFVGVPVEVSGSVCNRISCAMLAPQKDMHMHEIGAFGPHRCIHAKVAHMHTSTLYHLHIPCV